MGHPSYFCELSSKKHDIAMVVKRINIWNTKESGTLEFLVFRNGKKFVGVCLTLDIVEEGDNPQKLMNSIVEAAMGHVRLVQEKSLDESLLNRPAPDEYWQIYQRVLSSYQMNVEPNSFISTLPIMPSLTPCA